jgi:hypothetical protein
MYNALSSECHLISQYYAYQKQQKKDLLRALLVCWTLSVQSIVRYSSKGVQVALGDCGDLRLDVVAFFDFSGLVGLDSGISRVDRFWES